MVTDKLKGPYIFVLKLLLVQQVWESCFQRYSYEVL